MRGKLKVPVGAALIGIKNQGLTVEGSQISPDSGNSAVSTFRRSTAWIVGALAIVTAGSALPQGNIDAGKSPAQMFADTCSNCHRRPQQLRRASASFLRQHYTPGAQEAAAMAGYLASIPAAKERPRPKAQPQEKAKAQQQAQERPKAPQAKGKRPELAKLPPPEPAAVEAPPETRAEAVVPKLEPFEE